ncbi:alpha/beta hydrolase [Aurantiacibacter sp. MUD61]|uniref:alpha/beta hydrolase n=1 Tax=Aurantiacibacter sp. MUD61 TaxID=3009083 RepID=UPI0022F0C019|nr:alpha/beta hydrolase [Aurantiacibacter sp. MUD61]
MFRHLSILAALIAPLCAVPAAAQQGEVVVVIEEWVEVRGASRYVSPEHEAADRDALAAFGPFRVIDDRTAALVDITDGRSPSQFAAMLSAFPQIAVLEFIEAPGTHNDLANLRVGRMIREHGIVTRAPEGGSVRSGAVELFLAGVSREIAAGSSFAVHGWLDDYGMGAEDYPAGAPEHRRYLDYYSEMGMDEASARAFYAMTNSVPFEDALWLTGAEMQNWMSESPEAAKQAADGAQDMPIIEAEEVIPRLAYLDLDPVLQ